MRTFCRREGGAPRGGGGPHRRVPLEVFRGLQGDGAPRPRHPRGVRRRGRRHRDPGHRGRGAGAGVRVDLADHPDLQARHDPAHELGLGGAEAASTCPGWPRGEIQASYCLSEADAGSDVASMRAPGRARRRRLRPDRVEVLDHQCRHLRRLHRLRQDRPRRRRARHLVLPGREGLGRPHRQARGQAGHAGQPDRGGRARRGARAGHAPHRRGGPGLHHRHAHARPQPSDHRGPGGRHRPGCHRLRRRRT